MALKGKVKRNPDGTYVIPERDYRLRLIEEAKWKGCEVELLQLFDKWDKVMRNCTNEEELKAMGKLGVLEVSNLLDGRYLGRGGNLIIGGEVAKTSKDDEENK
jgi:hypothetical protein